MAWRGLHTTNNGMALLNQCLTTGTFRIVRVDLGDGTYTGSFYEAHGCINPVLSFSGDKLRVIRKGNITTVEISLTNSELSHGFYYREHAVFASDGNTTVCFLYDNAGSDAEYINDNSSLETRYVDDRISFNFTVSQEASVNVEYTSDVYVFSDEGEAGGTVVTFDDVSGEGIDASAISSGSKLSKLIGIMKALIAKSLTMADVFEAALAEAISRHNEDLNAHDVKRRVIGTRIRDPTKPEYGAGAGGDRAVALHAAPYAGSTEIGVVVSGTEYDAENMSANANSAASGTLIVKKLEE